MGAEASWFVRLCVTRDIIVEAQGVTAEEAGEEAAKEHGGRVIEVYRFKPSEGGRKR